MKKGLKVLSILLMLTMSGAAMFSSCDFMPNNVVESGTESLIEEDPSQEEMENSKETEGAIELTAEEETAEIMGMAIEKMESVSKMLFRAIEANQESTVFKEQQRKSVRTMNVNEENNRISVYDWNCNEAVVRQIFVNYPYA